jgi:release factor glutamine methyltransferase
MPSRSKSVFCGDFAFSVFEDVYEPAEDTFLMIDNLEVRVDDSVLDVGTGCGISGILSAYHGAKVIATDISPCAIRCAKENAKSSQLHAKIDFIQGDLFNPIKKELAFDLILFNPPYLPIEPMERGSWLDAAWIGGTSGRKIIDRFIREAPEHVNRDGSVLMVQSNLSGIETTISMFKKENMEATVVAKRNYPFFETLVLLRVKHFAC